MRVRAKEVRGPGCYTCAPQEKIIDVPHGVSIVDAVRAAGCEPNTIMIVALDQNDCKIIDGIAYSEEFSKRAGWK